MVDYEKEITSNSIVFSRTIELIKIWKHPEATWVDLIGVTILLFPSILFDSITSLPEYIINKLKGTTQ